MSIGRSKRRISGIFRGRRFDGGLEIRIADGSARRARDERNGVIAPAGRPRRSLGSGTGRCRRRRRHQVGCRGGFGRSDNG